MGEDELADLLGGQLPDMQERARLVREVGCSISGTWNCSVSNMIAAANGSACKLVDLVTGSFAGFRDACIYRFMPKCVLPEAFSAFYFRGRQVFLLKRAQIFVADVWGMLKYLLEFVLFNFYSSHDALAFQRQGPRLFR